MSKDENEIRRDNSLAVGGQALIEGIMMRGQNVTSMAIRKLDGEIVTKVEPINSWVKKHKIDKIPFIRGVFNFLSSMIIGTKALMFSAKFFDIEETEKEKIAREKKGKEKKTGEMSDALIYLSVIIGLAFSVGLFIIIPNILSSIMVPEKNVKLYNIVESLLKFTIFILYLIFVSQMKDIKRVFEYHGAEHKTIFCYENGLELNVENVEKQSRFHPRCGTNFMIIVLIVSALVFILIGRNENMLINIGYRLLLLPVIASISYEIIKFAGKSKNAIMKIVTWPGLMLQRLTTREPDKSQIEVAITALKLALDEENS